MNFNVKLGLKTPILNQYSINKHVSNNSDEISDCEDLCKFSVEMTSDDFIEL